MSGGRRCQAGGWAEQTIDEDVKKMWRTALRYSAVGIEMGAAVALGYGGGWWLDGKLGTKPYLSFTGLLFGIAAVFMTLVRVARELNRQSEQDEKNEKNEKNEENQDNEKD